MSESREILDVTILAGEVLLHNGAEIFRVQETMLKIAHAYGGKRFQVYAISNGIFASIEEEGEHYSTAVRHIPLSPVHLGRVAEVNQLSREIVEGKWTLEEAKHILEDIKKMPYRSWQVQTFWAAIGSGCFCYLLGGSVRDALAALLGGMVLYLFFALIGAKNLSKMIATILGSGLVTFCGILFFTLGLGENLDKIIIGSIIPLVPGVPFTNSIRDFFNSDYLSGTIRIIDALLIASCIAIGVGVVLKVWNSFGGVL